MKDSTLLLALGVGAYALYRGTEAVASGVSQAVTQPLANLGRWVEEISPTVNPIGGFPAVSTTDIQSAGNITNLLSTIGNPPQLLASGVFAVLPQLPALVEAAAPVYETGMNWTTLLNNIGNPAQGLATWASSIISPYIPKLW